MTRPVLYLAGKHLDLSKRIGKGGEGEVYLLPGQPKKAVKVYTGSHNPEREAKVQAMVRAGLSKTSNLVSFPEDIVTSKSGEFAGFTMRLVEGFRPLHELYGPKSRKIHYPKADYRFLVRAAANSARAVGQVHRAPCVIGDLNHSGILVSHDATVALIDADSFQFRADNRTYHCLVGVPDFTPPELQGHSLNGVVRTTAHDNFGLAVAMFQLLFMGRHPYAGRQNGGDLTLDQLIARNLFAYTQKRSLNVAPPGVVATLDDLPSEIANAFERAFGLDPHRRPDAPEWVRLLQGLEARLSRCVSNPMHFYPTAARGCPWCRMEAASGAILFLPPFLAANLVPPNLDKFDVDKVWAIIGAVTIPDAHNITPQLPSLPTTPSIEAKRAKDGGTANKIFGVIIAIVAICLWSAYPQGTLLWIGVLIYAIVHYNRTSVDPKPWQAKYAEADRRWDEALARWHANLGVNQLRALKANLERAVTEYRGVGAAKAHALHRLNIERQNRQLHEFLDRFLIARASVPGIGPAKTTTLASFGIESAADITRSAIMAIPGFGRATADKLLAWRAIHEKRFVYNPAPLPSDLHARAKVENEYIAKAQDLAKKISSGQVELSQLANTFRMRLNTRDSALEAAATHRAQLEADLQFLGLAKPVKSATAAVTRQSSVQLHPMPTPSHVSSVTCPSCGAGMVRRTARRGYRRGGQFWGCSRYPVCKGTRP